MCILICKTAGSYTSQQRSDKMQNFKIIMSITSSATASRDREVPSTNIVFRSRLCLVTITKRDGTPMDASSISEEDIMGICIKKAHTHLLGVLHYSAMESVILFCTADELKCASYTIVEVMELQDEAITVKAMAPLDAHITAYMMVWHSKPSTGDGEPHTPPHQTPPSGATLHHLQADLGNLADNELWQLMEELHQEISQQRINTPPAVPLQANGHVIFGTIVSFNMLMQNFYKITQGSSEKVPSFATRLEGTLYQIRLRSPR